MKDDEYELALRQITEAVDVASKVALEVRNAAQLSQFAEEIEKFDHLYKYISSEASRLRSLANPGR